MLAQYNPLCVVLLVLAVHTQYAAGSECKSGAISYLQAVPTVQILTSPNYPNGYSNTQLCRWQIKVMRGSLEVVRYQIQNTIIRDSATCGEDYLELRDGPDTWSRTIRRWCGERPLEKEMTSSGESLFVTFRADGQYTEKGFELKYWAVPKGAIEYEMVEFKLVNYILFVIFGLLLTAILLGLALIILVRWRRKQTSEKVKVEKNMNAVEVFIDKKDAKTEKWGNDNNGVLKRCPANGSQTRVIKLEPALGCVDYKDTTTTPV